MSRDGTEQLTKYLTDAHSIEQQSLAQLRTAPDIAGEPTFAKELRDHLHETETHEARVRELLEARGASPSRLKDAVMYAGGKGFLLFARSQTDTPGKLATHALSYEALEWASYDLLSRTAETLGELDVAQTAADIRDEERSMMGRIEAVFDRTVAASLEDVVRDDIMDHVRSYLADAHALEAQSIQLLESGVPMVAEYPALARLFETHLAESRDQQQRVEQAMEAVGGRRSLLKDAGMRLGALNWGMFFLGHPDTPAKLTAFAYAFEHLEIGGYEQLRRVAERAGDSATAAVAREISEQERATAEKLAGAFGVAVEAALQEQGVV